MERVAWKAVLQPGRKEEYIKRHNEIWPEMTQLLNEASIRNYTIWSIGDELFGYYETDSEEFSNKIQANSPIVDKWNESMQGITVVEIDPETGTLPALKCVFTHGCDDK